jgi:hypothetical protein
MFFLLAIYRHFFDLKKTLATNTKGVFHLKSQKTDSNLFGRWGAGCHHIYAYWLQF